MSSNTILARQLPQNSFAQSVVSYIRSFADQTAQTMNGAHVKAHLARLADLHNHMATLPPDDPRLVSLYELHMKRGERGQDGGFDRYEFIPTKLQKQILAFLGNPAKSATSQSALVDELVMAGIIDTIEQTAEFRAAAGEAQRELEAAAHALDREKAAHAETRGLIEQAEARAAQAEADRRTAEEEVEFLRAFIPDDTEPTRTPEKPRRTKVEGHTGIYLAANQTDYEIIYKEGRQNRYRIIGPDLDEAIAARREATEAVAA